MEQVLKDGTVMTFTNIGTDRYTSRDVYLSDQFLPREFQMHSTMSATDWKSSDLRKNLDFYLLENFDKEFIKELKPDVNGDIISIPSIEELFSPAYDDIFIDAEKIKDAYHNPIRELGGIYWLKNNLPNISGMFCTCCNLGGQDVQVQTNYENVRVRFLL